MKCKIPLFVIKLSIEPENCYTINGGTAVCVVVVVVVDDDDDEVAGRGGFWNILKSNPLFTTPFGTTAVIKGGTPVDTVVDVELLLLPAAPKGVPIFVAVVPPTVTPPTVPDNMPPGLPTPTVPVDVDDVTNDE